MSETSPLPVPRPRRRRLWWIALIASLAVTAGLTAELLHTQGKFREETLGRARSLAAQAAGSIDKSFHEARDLADLIARDLEKGTLPYTGIEERMRAECGKRSDLDGLAITFQPFMYEPGQKLYQEYVSRQGDGQLGI